jgi:uncharacterized protein
MSSKSNSPHQSHPAILKRLKRAEGQVRSIIGMLETQRPCLEIAQQLQAVESAIRAAKKTLIHDHIDHCLDRAANGGTRASIEEFKTVAKYL